MAREPAEEVAGEPVAVAAGEEGRALLVLVAAVVDVAVAASVVTLVVAAVLSAAAIVRLFAVATSVVLFLVPIVAATDRWARRRMQKIRVPQKYSNADSFVVVDSIEV
jgi:hypothetical protein